ncbi:hypothetical protein [Pedobacter borealis]|uniref:hypothetical protein n=1 Tax=Pedobacter borealis TaxID=475254 RepID=UPI00049367CD|nr:hypothetical protein [Pedobacter borealis]
MSKLNNELLLKIDEDRIYLTPFLSLPFDQTNILYQYLGFKKGLYWMVKIDDYNPALGVLNVQVIDYSPTDKDRFIKQRTDKIINQIIFAPMKWDLLSPQLWWHQQINLKPMLEYNESATKLLESTASLGHQQGFKGFSHLTTVDQVSAFRYTLELKIPFSNLLFKNGYVTFDYWVRELGINKTISFVVLNTEIIEAFEEVKEWFSKKLGKKRITVVAQLSVFKGQTDHTASSPDIEAINKSLIEEIKQERVMSICKAKNNETGQLLSLNSVLELTKITTGILQDTEQEVIEIIMKNGKVRNKAQIQYLANIRQTLNQKIKFTLYPYFGFLFTIEGIKHTHFVWEQRNSNATYVWSTYLDTTEPFFLIEREIKQICSSGRDVYKSSQRQNRNVDIVCFATFFHSKISKKPLESFESWKNKLENYLYKLG